MPIDTMPPDPTPSGGTETREDRRRPGRLSIDNAHLIALLRAPVPDAPQPDPPLPALPAPPLRLHFDDLAPAQGILFAAALGILLWSCAVGAIVLALYERF